MKTLFRLAFFIFLVSVAALPQKVSAQAWYNSTRQYRKNITFNSSRVELREREIASPSSAARNGNSVVSAQRSEGSFADYIKAHKNILALTFIFILSLLSLGFYKSKQKSVSANLIICAMAFSGGAVLIYEVASTQALTYFFNSSSYSVATAIISFLLGLALGSFIISRYLYKIINPIKTLIILQVSAGLYALLVLPQYGHIISAMSFLYGVAAGSAALILIMKFLIGIVFLLFPTIMLGASFPLASSLIIKDIKTAGSDVGKLYSWDLIGAVLGALVSGFVLLPVFGLTLTFVFGAAMNLMAGLLISKIGAKKMWLALLAAAVFIPLVAFAINSQSLVLSDSVWVKDESGLPVKQLASGILFQENSPYGEIMVTKENNYTTLFIDKAPQCGTDYPILTQNLEILAKKLPKNQQALDIGLGCGYSSRLIGSSENIAHLNVVEINPVMSKVIKYFNNEAVLDNKKVSILNDDIMHYLARYQDKYDFINVDLSHAGVSNVAPFYTLEYFKMLKQHLAEGGTIRIWAAYGNYEYARSFYQTLSRAFDNAIIIKTGIDWENDYFSNIEFYVGAENLMPQTNEEKALQAKLDKEPIQFISTLDNQMISQIWQAWGRQYYHDYFDAKIIQTEKDKPYIKDAYIFPLDVKPGDTMQAGVRVIDLAGVKSVKISFPHEKGTDWLEMKLVKGTLYDGFWSAEWKVHDTLDKEYESRMIVENAQEIKAEKNIKWSDAGAGGCSGAGPPTIGLDSGTYSATVGGTFSVTVALTFGSSSGCTYSIQDNTSGSYATVPATDTDLDCNGATCNGTSLPLTKTLKCEAAGTYNIRGLISPSTASSVSTVSCTAGAPTPAPVSSPAYATFGKSVSLALAFNITGRTADSVSGSDDYVAAASPDAVLGIAGTRTFGSRYDVNYSSDNYIIELRAPIEDSRFFMVFTPGNSTVISSRIESLKANGILAKTFGDFRIVQPDALDIFFRVNYNDVNILGRLQLGPGYRKIGIRNNGIDNKGVTNVTIELIK